MSKAHNGHTIDDFAAGPSCIPLPPLPLWIVGIPGDNPYVMAYGPESLSKAGGIRGITGGFRAVVEPQDSYSQFFRHGELDLIYQLI